MTQVRLREGPGGAPRLSSRKPRDANGTWRTIKGRWLGTSFHEGRAFRWRWNASPLMERDYSYNYIRRCFKQKFWAKVAGMASQQIGCNA